MFMGWAELGLQAFGPILDWAELGLVIYKPDSQTHPFLIII